MIISLFSSRLLLQELGVNDMGTYGLVGGIVSMFASLKTMFTSATQRYLNFEIGHEDNRELNKVFNISILVNVAIIVVFFLLVEICGLWLLEQKLQISPDRMAAARWVFHLSVLAAMVTIFNIPFDADIIARERMNVFAYVSILDAIAKLTIILLLPVLGGDKLIVYGTLILLVTLSDLLINWIYCHHNFSESRFNRFSYHETKEKFKEMFSYSSWAFFGNVAYALTNEGINVLLNLFGGTVANASRTIAYQVRGAVSNITSNAFTAVKPQVIQSYAQNNMDRYYKLSFTGGKIVGYMFLLLAVPICFGLNEILSLWLTEVPANSVSFITAIFVYMFVRALHESIGIFFAAIGKLKKYQLTECILLGSSLLFTYIGFKWLSMPLYGAFLCMAFSELLNMIAMVILAREIGRFDVRRFLIDVVFPYFTMGLISVSTGYAVRKLMNGLISISDWYVLIYIFVSVVLLVIQMYFWGLNKDERGIVIKIIKRE